MLTLANPAGLWALLGIPAVLAIHFLQRQAKNLPISTLFLLEKTQRESISGRRFDRLMNSVPLWMQLLAVLLLAWVLSEPRYQKARSTQRVAVVLDGSASMSVFREELKEELLEVLPDLQGPASVLELVVMESGSLHQRLYGGDSIEDAVAALDEWNPSDGVIDPTPAIRIARSLVAREGIVVFATDTPREGLPFEARLLSVGDKIENVGITGIRFENKEGALVWNAVVRNYSDSTVSRTWSLRFPDGNRSEPKSFEIGAGALVSLQAAFPKERERAVLELSPDRFTLDDAVPIVPPAPKRLSLFSATSPEFEKLAERMVHSLENVEPTNDAASADLSLVAYDPLDPGLPDGNAAVFVNDTTKPGAYLKGGIVAEAHALVAGLNWQSLLVRESIQLERLTTDDVVLWQERRPLIFLREVPATEERPASRQLCFNFDLRRSNALRQPAFIVCLHRFTESIRQEKVAAVRENLESGQPIEIAANGNSAEPVLMRRLELDGEESETTEFKAADLVRFKAPKTPCFIRVRQGENELLDASVFFADTREADFSACAEDSTVDEVTAGVVERHTEEDHWWRAWILLLVAALGVSWYFTKDGPAEPKAVEKPA
ncbi:VonWillebr and factor type A domain-containing protein [Haloferula helveola]|uniref:vonWillebr and factor type A domain-containing protein n=1 Tax=Haloferula helveola TaxID=490095 RepID=A0ABM7RE83_9BACT|nr:VonWillebr and factor type A domain-containing protein [Haloferula helveola]